MTTDAPLMSSKCRICSAPNASVHFGVDACRACSSFFKRTKLSGSPDGFPCRKGDRKCSLRREAGSMCRGCRYDRCTAIGMKYDGPMRAHYPKEEVHTAIESIPSTSKTSESLLERIAREHAVCVERRRDQELILIKQHNLARNPHTSEEVYMANFACGIAIFSINVAESWQFFVAVFPSIKELPVQDQRQFFGMCMPQFAMLDCFSRTKRIWGGFTKYSMCSVLLCTDMNAPEQWIGEDEAGPNREELLQHYRAFAHDQMALLVPSFEKADICEKEKHALLALLLCESDLQCDLGERFQPFFEEVRRQIFADLHRFYTEENGLIEYSTRLGTILTLCHTFRELNTVFQESLRMQLTLFDVYITQTMLHDLLL
ncbi:hypothetical protein PENTCL1PPCAC_16433 [Pristionchus entomophagus]|uniref:Nuclear receptor n=1 Tax=Pristionchus entomophagus TaxID=358040 RepID=A0AAV5TIS2_9BILA|nr:hypothetical protein PENTCL1PPCAC_16433 [Pristionchus entomophagus]